MQTALLGQSQENTVGSESGCGLQQHWCLQGPGKGRPPLPGCRSASVSTEDAAFLCSKSTRMILFPFGCVSSANQIPEPASAGEPPSGTPFVWTGQACEAFHLFQAPRAQSIFEEFLFFQRFFFFFFFLPLPTFCLRENEMSIFCFLIFFQESKGLLTSSLSPPFLPSSRRYSSEKKRTKYCSCSLS